jgi:hypothetical protein
LLDLSHSPLHQPKSVPLDYVPPFSITSSILSAIAYHAELS